MLSPAYESFVKEFTEAYKKEAARQAEAKAAKQKAIDEFDHKMEICEKILKDKSKMNAINKKLSEYAAKKYEDPAGIIFGGKMPKGSRSPKASDFKPYDPDTFSGEFNKTKWDGHNPEITVYYTMTDEYCRYLFKLAKEQKNEDIETVNDIKEFAWCCVFYDPFTDKVVRFDYGD